MCALLSAKRAALADPLLCDDDDDVVEDDEPRSARLIQASTPAPLALPRDPSPSEHDDESISMVRERERVSERSELASLIHRTFTKPCTRITH